MKSGLLHVHSVDTLLSKVEAIGVDQEVLGRIVGYGSVTVTGTGGTTKSFHGIRDPLRLRMKVQEQIAGKRDA